ncbi:MAG TPA: hypothetical protein VH482_34960 [Thermomicrobiales bacterium]|jgi:hypothetical protein
MIRPELAQTLTALIEGLVPPTGSGLVVTAAEMDVPLEVSGAVIDGNLIFYGAPPHSRWKSGLLPPVHLGHLSIAVEPTADAPRWHEDEYAG